MKKISGINRLHLFFQPFLQLVLLLLIISNSYATEIHSKPFADPAIEGRWDMTIYDSGKEVPSWLEVRHSGLRTLVGHFVGAGGSARPISEVFFNNGKINFSLPPQWEEESNYIVVEGFLQGDSLKGTIIGSDGRKFNWVAFRAPALKRTSPPVWEKPIRLFNGNNLDGWHALGKNQWVAASGILKSPQSGSNLVSDKAFTDFKLHIEFRYPTGSNSGVYLRGRYEVQISDSKGKEPLKDEFGAVYGFITPTEMVAKNAGEWQSYDITLVGRRVSVVANGKTIICDQEIPGITGGAINSKEGEPGPLLIQGDHGPIEYRNIMLTPAK